jgi:MFS superfamily sulfate permease-like transporter
VLLLLYGKPLLQAIPVAGLAGVMILVASTLINRWAGPAQRARRKQSTTSSR